MPFVLVLVAVALALAACSSNPVVQPAKECPDPCCGGNPSSVDCAEHPTLTCQEDAALCSARVYGCTNGSYFIRAASPLPAGCAEPDAEADANLLGDVSLIGSEDADGAGDAALIESDADASR